jgi:hypothetical protein
MLTSLDKLNYKLFHEQLHTQFKVILPNNSPFAFELIKVVEADPSPKIEMFMLHFRGPSAPHLPQQTLRLEHDKLGTFEIFLTAISAEPEGIVYESVFHRFRKTAP